MICSAWPVPFNAISFAVSAALWAGRRRPSLDATRIFLVPFAVVASPTAVVVERYVLGLRVIVFRSLKIIHCLRGRRRTGVRFLSKSGCFVSIMCASRW